MKRGLYYLPIDEKKAGFGADLGFGCFLEVVMMVMEGMGMLLCGNELGRDVR